MRASEPVNRIMSASVVWVDVDAPVREVLRLFLEYPVHHLPVVEGGRVVGLLSSADIMKLECFLAPVGAARDRLLEDRFQVRTLMRTPVLSVTAHESVERAAELMASHAIHSLPVFSSEGRLVGIVTTTDIMATFLRSAEPQAADPDAEPGEVSQQRLTVLELIAREARRYVRAGKNDRLHASLIKAIESLERIDERGGGKHSDSWA